MTESQQQINFIEWLKWNYPNLIYWHTPNGEVRSPMVGAKLKKMGVKKGVPDLFIPQHKCFIEFKTTKGKLTKDQEKLKPHLESYGYIWITAYGFLDGVKKFKEFIDNDNKI